MQATISEVEFRGKKNSIISEIEERGNKDGSAS
jgi:hypothetical protein